MTNSMSAKDMPEWSGREPQKGTNGSPLKRDDSPRTQCTYTRRRRPNPTKDQNTPDPTRRFTQSPKRCGRKTTGKGTLPDQN